MKVLNLLLAIILLASCSNEMLVRDSFHKSVVIVTKDGNMQDGTVIDITTSDVVFVSGKTKKSSNIKIDDIVSVQESENFYDNKGYEIAEKHIDKYKSMKNTFLYSAIGSIGGALIGGLSYGLLSSEEAAAGATQNEKDDIADDNKSKIVTGAIIGAIGGGAYGGIMGHKSDVREAIDKVRLRREALYKIQDEKKKN